jgi:hypothetical protein
MKGANTEPWAKISKAPIMRITKIIGARKSFFRLRKKINNSFKKIICFLKIDF